MMLTLELNPSEEQEFLHLAEQQGKPINQLLREVMQEYLEDIHDAALADQAIERLERGESSTTSLQDVKRKLGLT